MIRIVAVQTWLSQYGVNPWVYAAVDFGSSIPTASPAPGAVGALVDADKRSATRWGLLATVMFLLPDLYILEAGHTMPWRYYAAIGLIVTVGAFLTLRSAKKRIAAARST